MDAIHATDELNGHFIRSIKSHVPRVLIEQLLSQMMKIGAQNSNQSIPNVKYFKGALLLIDISGFTALSTVVTPEVLKTIINDYFSSIIRIVDKFGGDVIKFAGGASLNSLMSLNSHDVI